MKLFENKKQLLLIYGLFLIWAIVVWILHYFSATPLSITLTFLLLIFLPGFSLARIFRIKFENDNLGQVILFLALGFVFDLLLNFAAILLGLNIDQLIVIYLISLIGLFSMAFILNFRFWQKETTSNFNFKDVFSIKNLIYLLPLFLVILVLGAVSQKGGNFDGDPRYHLAIIRKAIEGRSLTPSNLSYFKTSFSIAYVFPVWHLFLALLSKITTANIFIVWAQTPVALSAIVLVVWYWFIRKILKNNFLTVLAFSFFAIFIFRTDGYILTRLVVPDTLSELLILPLSLGISLEYFFGKEKKLLFLIPILVICMAAVHFTQYFYFLLLIFSFGLIYFISQYKNIESKEITKNIFRLVLINLAILIPFVLLLELKNHLVTNTLKNYLAGSAESSFGFGQFDLLTQISFILLPFTLLFVKKRKSILLLFSAFVMIALVYGLPFVEFWLNKLLTPIFVKRLYDNFDWFFIVIALLLGYIFILIDGLITKCSKLVKGLINGLLIILSFILIGTEVKYRFLSSVYNKLFWSGGDNFLAHVWVVLFLVSSIITVAILLRQRQNPDKVLDFEEPKNKLTAFLLVLIVTLLFASPILHQKISKSFFVKIPDPTLEVVKTGALLNQDTADFIKEGIPPKSFIYSDRQYYSIPLLFDQYLPGYYSGSDRAYQLIFRADSAFGYENKLKCLKSGNIEYLFVTSKDEKVIESYDKFPQYFEKLYKRTNISIYKINYTQAETDGLDISSPISCDKKAKK